MIRARQRVELQAQAVCRRLSDGDKIAAAKLWSRVKADPDDPLRSWLDPYILAMSPLEAAQVAIEKGLKREVRKLPIVAWSDGVKGLGDISLAGILGECAYPLDSYKSVAAVWKRMGLAVIGEERQRKRTGEDGILHGYNPQRRTLMWNVGCALIKAQVRKDPEDPDKRIAIGDYGALYLERKALEAERVETKAHAHNRAQRYIEKRLLRELYAAWNKIDKPNEE